MSAKFRHEARPSVSAPRRPTPGSLHLRAATGAPLHQMGSLKPLAHDLLTVLHSDLML